ncbi:MULTISPECIES: TraI/MobA(P) family conjugative relaxase [Thiomonas]|uniref:Relaxase/mobilization nuclease family protein n=2 Tax=Thiomonas TaxID=32012 RepID=A0A238D2P5_THIDL|nr:MULTISPECIES: TraI/MobA(P) family conjugative relaxase [Thiomonas]CQR44807.1 Relaxase/mobilization nuclease family protein [Thiomonas sp. CB3]MBN8744643.1 relaxase/mobilization nuclease domain-containing protein [Thiomonas arsenitoxydans]ODU91472.1 MAG: relaxase/mobilization nuclease [Thiomonas sp. SCN 64-16]CDW92579.1 Relaxase/mobilization nuclease family protein [Thiomonas sp. CB2]SBP87509.1 Relaxase/mobilization nuclease family protein [Thiomonas delicata]
MLAKVITLKPGAPSKGFAHVMRYVMRAHDELPPGQTLDGGHFNIDDDQLYWTLDEHRLAYAEDLAGVCDGTARDCERKGRFKGNPVYHVAITWQEGEHPTVQQAEHACKHVMDALGFGEHQAAWATHRDTDNDHVHLVINRVHPEKLIAVQPPFKKDYFILDRCMRELELEFGYARANGPYITLDTDQGPTIVRMSRAERRERGLLKEDGALRLTRGAAAAEYRLGADSFQSWVAVHPARDLRAALQAPSSTWADAHQALAQHGVTLQAKGSGLVVTTQLDNGRILAAKASQLGRWASKAELEKRLGPFVPALQTQAGTPKAYAQYVKTSRRQTDKPERAPQKISARDPDLRALRRQLRADARAALAARFEAEQAAARAQRPQQRAELRSRHQRERQELAAQTRQERKTLTTQARQQGQPLAVVQSLWALKAAQQREALQKRQAAERKALSVKLPKQEVWRKWVEREASQGDEAAQAALRGIRYREQRKKNQQQDGIEGEELDPLRKLTLAGLEAQIDRKRQLVLYRDAQGRDRFTDTGPRIVLHDKGADSLEAALRMAAQKYGGKVDITGSSEFRERAARQAVRLGIEVMDADLQAVVQDEQRRLQRPPQLSPKTVEKSAPTAAKPLNPQADAGPPEMRAVDAALAAWQQAQTDAARTRAVQDWMRGMERIEQQGGDVAAASAHSRKALGGRYAGFMREVKELVNERLR